MPQNRGGRPPGVLNKRKSLLLDRLQREFPNYHPIVEMCKIANDLDNAPDLRFNANKEVAKYVEPQLRAIEHSGNAVPSVIIRDFTAGGVSTGDDTDPV